MAKFSLFASVSIEHSRSSTQHAGEPAPAEARIQDENTPKKFRPSRLLQITYTVFFIVLVTSIITSDASVLLDLSRVLVAGVAKIFGL